MKHSHRDSTRAVAGFAGKRIRAAGEYTYKEGEYSTGGSDEPRSRDDGREPRILQRPVLSAERFSDPDSTLAGAA